MLLLILRIYPQRPYSTLHYLVVICLSALALHQRLNAVTRNLSVASHTLQNNS